MSSSALAYKRGFKVLTPDSAEFEGYVTAVLAAHGRPAPGCADLEDFAQLRVSPDGQPVGYGIERGGLTPEIAKEFWKRTREAGFIDFANIIYYAFASRIAARTDLTLSGNFRSSVPIIDHANLLYPRTPAMTAVGAAKDFTETPEWQQGASAFDAIMDYFLPALDALDIPYGEAA